MTAEELKNQKSPDKLSSPLLKAMWMAAHDDWDGAHNIAQDVDTPDGARAHGYLHWVEGDLWNADYWYRRAGMSRPNTSLDEEWHNITNQLLAS
ncbi:MAG: hypothetical protein RIC80_01520 [Cyclobacteriaceae bacterium]